MSGGSWDGVVGVAGSVDALLFFGEVVVPVAVEVAVAVERAEFEDRFGAGQSPAGAGEVHPVFDEVPAGAFDDAGGDRPALGPVSYTHLRAHETDSYLVCRLLLEKKKKTRPPAPTGQP